MSTDLEQAVGPSRRVPRSPWAAALPPVSMSRLGNTPMTASHSSPTRAYRLTTRPSAIETAAHRRWHARPVQRAIPNAASPRAATPPLDARRNPSVGILGPLEVRAHDRVLSLGGPRQIALLSCLILRRNEAVPCDQLGEWLWREASERCVERLRMAIMRLRRAIAGVGSDGRVALRTVHGGYLLSLDPSDLDATAFETLVRDGQRALDADDPALASRLLLRALSLWRGPTLAEVSYHDFAQPEIRRLHELHLCALEASLEADLRLDHHQDAVNTLAALSDAHPTREHLAAQLMLALYRCGRQADALDTYRRVSAHLTTELGLHPGPALSTLQHRILNHDPTLHQPNHRDAPTQPPDH